MHYQPWVRLTISIWIIFILFRSSIELFLIKTKAYLFFWWNIFSSFPKTTSSESSKACIIIQREVFVFGYALKVIGTLLKSGFIDSDRGFSSCAVFCWIIALQSIWVHFHTVSISRGQIYTWKKIIALFRVLYSCFFSCFHPNLNTGTSSFRLHPE